MVQTEGSYIHFKPGVPDEKNKQNINRNAKELKYLVLKKMDEMESEFQGPCVYYKVQD